MKQLIYLTLLTPLFAVSSTPIIQPNLTFGSSQDGLVKTYSAKANGNLNGLKYEYYQINNYIYNEGISVELPSDIFLTITQIKFTLPTIENIDLSLTLYSSITDWEYNNYKVGRLKPYTSNYADFLTTQDYTQQMYYINTMNLGNWNSEEIWETIDGIWSYNQLASILYGDYGTNNLTIDTTKIFNSLNGAYGNDMQINKLDQLPANAPDTDIHYDININANNTEYKEFYYTRIQLGTCLRQDLYQRDSQGFYLRQTYNFVLYRIKTEMQLLPTSITPTTTDVVDIPQLMFTILTLPFAFISQAFNLTLFPGTPYSINISNLIVCLIAVFLLIFVLNIIKKVLK